MLCGGKCDTVALSMRSSSFCSFSSSFPAPACAFAAASSRFAATSRFSAWPRPPAEFSGSATCLAKRGQVGVYRWVIELPCGRLAVTRGVLEADADLGERVVADGVAGREDDRRRAARRLDGADEVVQHADDLAVPAGSGRAQPQQMSPLVSRVAAEARSGCPQTDCPQTDLLLQRDLRLALGGERGLHLGARRGDLVGGPLCAGDRAQRVAERREEVEGRLQRPGIAAGDREADLVRALDNAWPASSEQPGGSEILVGSWLAGCDTPRTRRICVI